MRDYTSQRPVYLLSVATGESRTADLEAFSRACAQLRSARIPFKVVEASGDDIGDYSVIVVSEEHRDAVFDIALRYKQHYVIYLDHQRIAYRQEDSKALPIGGEVLGEFKPFNGTDPKGVVYVDLNRNQAYHIV
jgi:hypothetical protein